MLLARLDFPSELRGVTINLLSVPTECMSHEQDKAFAISLEAVLSVHAHLLLNRTLRPAPNWVQVNS